MDRIDRIIDFWFAGADSEATLDQDSAPVRRWFGGDASVDREVRERFEEDVLRALEGEDREWERTPRGRLARVILLDQFTRNVFRGTPRAFAGDGAALDLCLRTLEEGLDEELPLLHRVFLYMPLMHAESREVQATSRRRFARLLEEARRTAPAVLPFLELNARYADLHADIVDRFGRYPHRNATLGRTSSPEELAFLEGPDSSF